MDAAITIKGLGKRYQIGEEPAARYLRETLTAGMRRIFRPRSHGNAEQEFWALRDIDLTVGHGETLGIIGNNGAGKSTLLKILSRIIDPTTGSVRLNGRVASLLEVGTGFSPELTGRENIFLNGAILGMSHSQIAARFDEIVDFSGVETFIDTPVKRYSSGMYMRLAFAVAAHLDGDILFMDEVLAVGDANFQNKCLNRMGELAGSGRTVVLVSHNLAAIRALCRRAIVLREGRIVDDGPSGEVVQNYQREGHRQSGLSRQWEVRNSEAAAETVAIALQAGEGGPDAPLAIDRPIVIDWQFLARRRIAELNPVIQLHTSDGALLLHTGPWTSLPTVEAGIWRARYTIPANLLNDGLFSLSLTLQSGEGCFDRKQMAIAFEVGDADSGRLGWYGEWPGPLRVDLGFAIDQVADGTECAVDAGAMP